jgi:hypothetical protein
MKWFKHSSTLNRDEAIAAYIDDAGLEGYGFLHLLMEIVSERMEHDSDPEATYPLTQWSRLLYSHHNRVRKYLQMNIKAENYPLAVSKKFITILTCEIDKAGADTTEGVVINFRDPDYSPERGGYHPVEVMVSADGVIKYITDFSYVGTPPYQELAKELDFDFGLKLSQQMGRDYPIRQGRGLFRVWQSNFCSYYNRYFSTQSNGLQIRETGVLVVSWFSISSKKNLEPKENKTKSMN